MPPIHEMIDRQRGMKMSFKDFHTLVFDIGKTHVKVSILNRYGDELHRNRRSNNVIQTHPYHSYDVEGIWLWLKGQLSELTDQFHISAISIATHGAAAALIDRRTQDLLLPVMDYEFDSYPEEFGAELGLNQDCVIYPGVHDSNAGYLPILRQSKTNRPTVVSTGTWSVIMDGNTDLETLDASRDMLVNIDAEGAPLATARYMGGREFSLICEQLNTDIATTFVDEDIEAILNSNTFIMPSFSSGSGPFPNHQGRIDFEDDIFPINGKAAATIYAALMLNNILKRLSPNATQDILIEGSFAQNSVLCGLLAALNSKRKVRTQNSGNGVTEGCFLLTRWQDPINKTKNPIVAPYMQDIFPKYAAIWESKLHSKDRKVLHPHSHIGCNDSAHL